MTEILDSGPSVDAATLTRAEEDLGRPLPAAFRAYLLEHNGGHPRDGLFSLGEGAGRSVVQTFLRIQDGHRDDIRDPAMARRGRLPAWLLPIGYDPGGNPICIATAGSETGAIYFWDHESESDAGPADETPAIRIAHDFESFLSNLTGS
jgi:cell wall assembly regulator SMI1